MEQRGTEAGLDGTRNMPLVTLVTLGYKFCNGKMHCKSITYVGYNSLHQNIPLFFIFIFFRANKDHLISGLLMHFLVAILKNHYFFY